MSRAITTQTRRELRRIIGPEMAEIVGQHNATLIAMAGILNGGFWRRFRWLLFGR